VILFGGFDAGEKFASENAGKFPSDERLNERISEDSFPAVLFRNTSPESFMRYMLSSNDAAAIVLPLSEIARNSRMWQSPVSLFRSISVRFDTRKGDYAWAGIMAGDAMTDDKKNMKKTDRNLDIIIEPSGI
jgi:hypothetical protein